MPTAEKIAQAIAAVKTKQKAWEMLCGVVPVGKVNGSAIVHFRGAHVAPLHPLHNRGEKKNVFKVF